MSKNDHLYSLDLLRGFSGYGVAFCHLHAFIYDNTHLEYFSLLFVEFFFVLSGFVLYPQLIQVLNNKKNLFTFYKRRWLRTLPLYFITLILVASLFNDEFGSDFFKYLLFVQKILPNFLVNDYYPVAWSLSIEEFFYLLFPILIIFFGKKNSIKKIIFFFIFLITLKFFFAAYTDSNFFRTGTLFRFDAILLGFIIRFFYNNIIKYKYLLATFLIFFLFIFYNFENYILNNSEDYIIKTSFILLLQLISLLTLITFILLEPLMKIDIIRNFSVLVSKQTYSVYLTHIIFIYLLEKTEFGIYNTVIIYIILLFITSSLIFKFIEKPILKIRPKLQ